MQVLVVLLVVYLVLGLIYALYILLFGYDDWYHFPLNVVAGPVAAVIAIYYAVKRKKIIWGR